MDSPGNASVACPNGSQWIMEVFNECAQDGRDVASVVLGLVSILCFAAASFPQFYLACKTGIMDQALSLYFLLGWLGGDSLNLIGSFLANQLPLQVYTAIYYVLADLLMISLYVYYKIKNQNRRASASINAVLAFVLFGTVSAAPFLGRPALSVDDGTPASFRGRTLLSSADDSPGWEPFSKKEIVGFVIGSVSAVLYLASRIPQIYTNVSRVFFGGDAKQGLYWWFLFPNWKSVSDLKLPAFVTLDNPGWGCWDSQSESICWEMQSKNVIFFPPEFCFGFNRLGSIPLWQRRLEPLQNSIPRLRNIALLLKQCQTGLFLQWGCISKTDLEI